MSKSPIVQKHKTNPLTGDEKTHFLSDYLSKKSCYQCIIKKCNKSEQHGNSFPAQFSNYVKCPVYINEIKDAIQKANLQNEFEGKKPFYVVCRNIHQECHNCNNLRVKFIDSDRIALCYPELDSKRDTITVGIHIDLKLVISNNSKYKIVPVPIHIDGEKLIENYCYHNLKPIEESESLPIENIERSSTELVEKSNTEVVEITEQVNDEDNEIHDNNHDNNHDNQAYFIPINDHKMNKLGHIENVSCQSLDSIFNSEKIPLDINTSLDIIEHPSPFNMEEDFPSLSSAKTSTPIQSPINFNKIKEQTEERIRIKNQQDELRIKKEKDYQKEFSVEITNSLLDEENRKLKMENIILSDKNKELEDKLRKINYRLETLKDFHKDPNTREYLIKWINNMNLINNSIIESFNKTYYKDVSFVRKIQNYDIER